MTPRKFRINPYPAICVILIRPVPNTIALGGVPIGSMNAQLADTVAGIINRRGSIPRATDAAAIMGKTVFTVATFEVNSVRNVSNVQTAVTSTHVG